MRTIVLAALAATMLTACKYDAPQSTERGVAAQQDQMTQEATQEIGLPRITNFTEKRLATRIEEMRDDPNLITYAYVQGFDGKLRCFGKGVGFGLPYAVQVTAAHKFARADCGQYSCDQLVDQSEPNGLYMPDQAEATWYMLIDPKTGKAQPTYVEPRLTVSPFPLTGPSVQDPCPS